MKLLIDLVKGLQDWELCSMHAWGAGVYRLFRKSASPVLDSRTKNVIVVGRIFAG